MKKAGDGIASMDVLQLTIQPLPQIFHDAGLTLVDIGARGGAFAPLLPLAPWARYVACEPAPHEADSLRPRLQAQGWKDVVMVREAIAGHTGEATMYVTRQPGLSSLLQPNQAIVRHYYRGDQFAVTGTTAVPTLALDKAARQYGFMDACFLKVDTQGTELEILRSGSRLLREAVLAVYVESLFHPFYLGQSLFADVDDWLRRAGFTLVDLSRTSLRRASFREDIYSSRQIVWAHALYFRAPGMVVERAGNDGRLGARYLAMALAFEQFDLALELVSTGLRMNSENQVAAAVERVVRHRTDQVLAAAKDAGGVLSGAHKDPRPGHS